MKLTQGLKLNKQLLENAFFIIAAAFFLAIITQLKIDQFDHISGDYNNFLRHWMDDIVSLGGWASLGTKIGDYSPPYVLLLTLLSYFPTAGSATPFLYGIKSISLSFDFLMAIPAFLIAVELFKKHEFRWAIAAWVAVVVFALPTVFLNGAFWGQIDASYTAFILFSLYWLLKDKWHLALIFYGIAFSFKLQAIFLFPLFIFIIYLNDWKKAVALLWIPVIYLAFSLPAVLAGRDIVDVLSIYAYQSNIYRYMTLNMPNLYEWFPEQYDVFSSWAIMLFGSLMALSLLLMTVHKVTLRKEHYLPLGIWAILMANFFLPAMHERYLFAADVIVAIYAFEKPKRLWLAFGVNLISLLAYFPYLFGFTPIPMAYVSAFYLFILIRFTAELFGELTKKETSSRMVSLH